jgi:hypothetical protein
MSSNFDIRLPKFGSIGWIPTTIIRIRQPPLEFGKIGWNLAICARIW